MKNKRYLLKNRSILWNRSIIRILSTFTEFIKIKRIYIWFWSIWRVGNFTIIYFKNSIILSWKLKRLCCRLLMLWGICTNLASYIGIWNLRILSIRGRREWKLLRLLILESLRLLLIRRLCLLQLELHFIWLLKFLWVKSIEVL